MLPVSFAPVHSFCGRRVERKKRQNSPCEECANFDSVMLCAVVREFAASGPQPLYAPAPEYPLGARVHYWTGNDIFCL